MRVLHVVDGTDERRTTGVRALAQRLTDGVDRHEVFDFAEPAPLDNSSPVDIVVAYGWTALRTVTEEGWSGPLVYRHDMCRDRTPKVRGIGPLADLLGRASLVVTSSEESAELFHTHYRVPTADVVVVPPTVEIPDRFGERSVAKPLVTLAFLGSASQAEAGWFMDMVAGMRTTMPDVIGVLPDDAFVADIIDGSTSVKGISVAAPDEPIHKLIARSSLLVMPAEPTAADGAEALVIAALAGVPAVVTRAPWSTELVADGRSGYLVERGDRAAMRARVEELVADDKRRAAFGRVAKRDARRFLAPSVVEVGWRHAIARVMRGDETTPMKESLADTAATPDAEREPAGAGGARPEDRLDLAELVSRRVGAAVLVTGTSPTSEILTLSGIGARFWDGFDERASLEAQSAAITPPGGDTAEVLDSVLEVADHLLEHGLAVIR